MNLLREAVSRIHNWGALLCVGILGSILPVEAVRLLFLHLVLVLVRSVCVHLVQREQSVPVTVQHPQ
jgi:hypothetical protein